MYLCKSCGKYFSIKVVHERFKNVDLLNDHLDGISFRKLGVKYEISKDKAYRIVLSELKALPKNNQFTHK